MKYQLILAALVGMSSISTNASNLVIEVSNTNQLLDAIQATQDASSNRRYLIKANPGTYFLSGRQIELAPYVRLEGSGESHTIIQSARISTPNDTIAACVIVGTDSNTISNMTVRNFGSGQNEVICG